MPGRPPLPGFAADLDPYVIEVNFEAIPDPKRGKEFLEIPTSFALIPEQVDRLIRIGPELLRAQPNFKEFMESLKTP